LCRETQDAGEGTGKIADQRTKGRRLLIKSRYKEKEAKNAWVGKTEGDGCQLAGLEEAIRLTCPGSPTQIGSRGEGKKIQSAEEDATSGETTVVQKKLRLTWKICSPREPKVVKRPRAGGNRKRKGELDDQGRRCKEKLHDKSTGTKVGQSL